MTVCARRAGAVRTGVRTRRTLVIVLGLVAAAEGAACKGVLGLDAPELDPCADGCADAALSPDGSDAAPGSRDAAPDRGAVIGVRCSGATPVCCQVTDDAGSSVYACRASAGACEGYAIACASGSDCPGNDVCCHFSSSTKCEPVSACADDALVCDPAGPKDQCPTGWTCKGPVVNTGQVSPYFSCAP
jgi:hypothetical protein